MTKSASAATLARLRADPQWQARLLAELARRAPETDDQLHAWVRHLLGLNIARRAVCSEHVPPFAFLADLYFGRVQRAVALGPRGGGKTRSLSVLEWLLASTAPTHIWHGGGSEEQAKRGYSYIRGYVSLPPFAGAVTDSLMSETRWANGSRLEVHAATVAQVSGPHPRVKASDETELWQPEVLERFWGMGVGEDVQTVFISTRDRANGLMQTLLDEAPQRQLTIFPWCIWDVKSECPECLQSRCELWDECQGKYQHSAGHRPRKDLADKYLSVSRDTWEAQYLCKRPGRQGLCFPDFVSEPGDPEHSNVTEAAEYRPDLKVALAFDDNIAAPRAGLFWQEWPDGRIAVWDEYYERGRLQAESCDQVMERLKGLGQHPELAVVPPEAVALKIALHQREVDTVTPHEYRRAQGAAVLAQMIRSANGQRRLLIHPRCTNLIHSLRIAWRKQLSPGVFAEEPEKHDADHMQDACLYLAWVRRFEE